MNNSAEEEIRKTDTLFVYVTAAGDAEAECIARTAVEERLAACANILGPVKSIYRWEGEVCEGEEFALILKTSMPRKDELIKRIQELHSYDCPCIVCLPVAGGNPGFLKWIDDQTEE